MFHPFFDPTPLSEQELFDKINEVSLRIAGARATGVQYEIVQTMFSVIHACEEELKTRYAKKELEAHKKDDTCVFDSDSYLTEEGGKKKNESTRKPNYQRGW